MQFALLIAQPIFKTGAGSKFQFKVSQMFIDMFEQVLYLEILYINTANIKNEKTDC